MFFDICNLDTWAQIYNVTFVVDGEEVAIIGPKGGSTTIQIAQRSHSIYANAWTANGRGNVTTDALTIQVSDYGWYCSVCGCRGDLRAFGEIKAMENSVAK